jgi:hypothetical protein
MTLLSILFGLAAAWYLADEKKAERLDFRHLSERAMLFVVFTFGEMIMRSDLERARGCARCEGVLCDITFCGCGNCTVRGGQCSF